MLKVALIGGAGAAGALARYAVGLAVGGRGFPWGTLAINVVGALALGYLLAADTADGRLGDTAVAAIGVGFLGAFTTFSTFAWEATALMRDGRPGIALAYVLASVVVGLAASALGYSLGARSA